MQLLCSFFFVFFFCFDGLCETLGSPPTPADDQDVLPLLSQATGLQLVSLFRSATKRDSNLLTFAERLCAVRPLRGLLGTPAIIYFKTLADDNSALD